MSDIFSPANLAKSVHDTLDQATAAIPEGKKAALLVDGTVVDGKPAARLLYVQKIDSNWSVSGQAAYDGHHVAGRIALAGSW